MPTILIVDDHVGVRNGIRVLLSSRSEWVVSGEASDGEEALQKTRSLRPDLVLMDVSMPGMDGLQATRIIRREVPDTKVLIVSQNDKKVVLRQAEAVGAHGFVAKAELASKLLNTIEKVIGAEEAGALPGTGNIPGDPESDRFKNVLDALPVAVYCTDNEGRLTYFNPAAVEFSGREPDLGTDHWCVSWKLFRPDGTPMPHGECPMAITIKEGRSIRGEKAIVERPDGTRRWFAPYPTLLKDEQGKTVGGLNMLLDITDRRGNDQASNLLAAIVGSSDDAIVSKNLDGVITSWNKSAERLFGYAEHEAVGRHITLIIPPDRREEEVEIISRLKRGERVEHFDTVRRRKDGTSVDVSLTISPVRDAAGRVVGASKVARDVSERKRAERRLRESEERHRALSEELEAEVRHRTAELERRTFDLQRQSEQLRDLSARLLQIQDEERRRIARDLHDSAGQSLTVLGMRIAQLVHESGRAAPEFASEVEKVGQLVQQVHQDIRTTSYLLHPPLLDETGLSSALAWYVQGLTERSEIVIDLKISEELGRLPGDVELAIFRLVQECLTNIHRHSGGKNASIRIAQTDGHVSVEVCDNGRGIPAQRFSEIQAGASGVGIRGMRERVRQLRGEMKVESDNNGTRVLVDLPIPKQNTAVPLPAQPSVTQTL